MNNEPVDLSNTKEAPKTLFFYQREAFQIVARIFITSTTVTTVLFPLEVFRTLVQTDTEKGTTNIGKNNPLSRNPFSFISPLLFNFGRMDSMVSGFMNSNKSSLVRNTMLTNKDSVSENVDSVIIDETQPPTRISKSRQYASLVVTTGLISMGDTLLTQYHTNLSIFNALKIIPDLNGKQKLIFATRGMAARGTKTFATTLGCIASGTAISDMLNPLISREGHYAPIHYLIAGSICGFIVAIPSNIGDVIYKNTLKEMNLQTLQMPTYQDKVRSLLKNNGVRIFFQGSMVGGFYNTLAFATFNGVSWYLDNRVFISENRNSFFSNGKPTSPPQDTPELSTPGRSL